MSDPVRISVRRLPHSAGLPLPSYATDGAAGMDLRAAVESDLEIQAGHVALVPTGLVIEIPPGFEAQVRPRSGLALKHQLTLLNTPGTIDSDYRGEVQVILANLGREAFTVRRGDRIAQMVVARVERALFVETDELSATDRGAGGFGHSGTGEAPGAPLDEGRTEPG